MSPGAAQPPDTRLPVRTALGFLLLCHVLVLLLSGPLWRDEAATVHLAQAPWSRAWASLQHESFPLAWLLVVRAWFGLGLGGTDVGLRVLGFLVGLGVLAALWYCARAFGLRRPFLALLLIAFSPVVLRVGDSLRAYGFALGLVLVALGAAWELARAPGLRPGAVLTFAGAGLLAVHSVLYASVVLGALLAGAALVACGRRSFAVAGALAATGAVVLGSVALYLPAIRAARSWMPLIRGHVDAALILRKLLRAWLEGGHLIAIVWLVALVATLVLSARGLRERAGSREADLARFIWVSLPLGLAGYLAFLLVLDYVPQPWYFLPLFALLAIPIDATLEPWLHARLSRRTRLACFWIVAAVSALPTAYAAVTRQSNVDLVAREIAARAAPDDLAIVCPWWCGISFSRYYRGAAPWTTLPEIADHSIHRYDLVYDEIEGGEGIEDLLARMRLVLGAGRRLWLATPFEPSYWERTGPSDDLSSLDRRGRGEDARMTHIWALRFGAELRELSARVRRVPTGSALPVNGNERLYLYEITLAP